MASFFDIIFKNYSVMDAVRAEIEEDVSFLVRYLPGITGCLLRYAAYKPLFGRIDSLPFIHPAVRFVFMRNIRLGKHVLVNSNSYLYGRGGITLGDHVMIAPNCSIVAGVHELSADGNLLKTASRPEEIVIESGCWVGANAVILGGVTLGQGSVIGAGAVVTKDTEPYSINVGVPAHKSGERKRIDHATQPST